MKLKLISGIYDKIESDDEITYIGYGIFDENNKPVAFLSWITKPNANKPLNVLFHKEYKVLNKVQSMPTLGHGISKIKQFYAELTNAN